MDLQYGRFCSGAAAWRGRFSSSRLCSNMSSFPSENRQNCAFQCGEIKYTRGSPQRINKLEKLSNKTRRLQTIPQNQATCNLWTNQGQGATQAWTRRVHTCPFVHVLRPMWGGHSENFHPVH